ncbi:MAG: Cytochrome oxidase, subunit I, putative [Methanomicrobiales archaeon 53_19]|jgi:archaeosortase A (PGF-CTERM-specific)|uniref:archaeosortase A n=1 Tax=Methanocalculus sp. TaxID=2004547 RepID=UPI000746993E|nr:archaeosortase A [Methanocalculus sp.]KUL05159.1 MAG: Cytochrome oxidase, subunit I, putative [Methanomicrobiales archaeon 53_19]HIJ05835.1 archaeosortase A [Methanocalculus sp.]
MNEYLVLLSCIGFLFFLLPHRYNWYAGIVGWASISLLLLFELPGFLQINNFLYPILGILSVPFVYLTARRLLMKDPVVGSLTRAAAFSFLIYAPFGFYEPLKNWLIGVVVNQTVWMLELLRYPVTFYEWNTIMGGSIPGFDIGFRVEIILGCTGITSIAIMLAVANMVPTTTRQKILSFLLIAPTIYILNLFRNAYVIMAYTGQWYPWLPELVGNGNYGYESFFWAHNVFCELLALAILMAIAYGLFRLIPDLGVLAEKLVSQYIRDIRQVFLKDR